MEDASCKDEEVEYGVHIFYLAAERVNCRACGICNAAPKQKRNADGVKSGTKRLPMSVPASQS